MLVFSNYAKNYASTIYKSLTPTRRKWWILKRRAPHCEKNSLSSQAILREGGSEMRKRGRSDTLILWADLPWKV